MPSVCFSWYTACFRDELDNVVKEEDGEWICFSGGNNLLGTNKYRGSNSSDGGNTGDEIKIAGRVIGSGGGIESSEELKEVLPDVADEAEVQPPESSSAAAGLGKREAMWPSFLTKRWSKLLGKLLQGF
ncbi:hypothetical protein Tco_1035059 [Tanacetum coccineum]